MKKKEFHRYMKEVFFLDIETEYAIYLYLCKKKIRKKKLLSDDIKFDRYKDWKDYIINKYRGYEKDGLQELDKMLNSRLRNSSKLDGYSKNISIACISATIAALLSIIINNNIKFYTLLILWILLPFFLCFLLLKLYDTYTLMSDEVYFYEDVKEIIDEIIAEKMSNEQRNNI